MRTICLDFDGVIHLNARFVASTIIVGEPVHGVTHAIERLREQYKVVVHSCRCASDGGVDAIKDWLMLHGIEVDDVVDYKPLAEVYVDDRAVPFDGDWSATIDSIGVFKPWHHRFRERYASHKASYKAVRRR